MSRFITWLHLSDLHATRPKNGWKSNKCIMSLIEDLVHMEEQYSLSPDLLLFSGDLAMGIRESDPDDALDEQFNDAALFIEMVRCSFSKDLSKSNIFIVPGNHDVNRNMTAINQKRFLESASTEDVAKMLSSGNYQWKRYMDRLSQYQEFLNRAGFGHLLTNQDKDHGLFSKIIEFHHSFKVAICGFNTAWSSSSDKEKGEIWIGSDYQISSFYETLKKCDLSIALMHHPNGWLTPEEDPFFRERIIQEYSFCLHGHEHYAWDDPKRGHTQIGSGACYSQIPDERGYNFVRINIDGGKGEIWLRKYHEDGWIPRLLPNRTDENGIIKIDAGNWQKPKTHLPKPFVLEIPKPRTFRQTTRTIRDVINEKEPFGPFDAKKINDVSIMRELFDQNNKLYNQFTKRPSIIEGRRGSGKTTFLIMVDGNEPDTFKIAINEIEIMELLLREINRIGSHMLLVESISNIWTIIFTILIGHRILPKLPPNDAEPNFIRLFLESVGISNSTSLKDSIKHFFRAIEGMDLVDLGLSMELGGIKYIDFEEKLLSFLQEKQYHVIVLIDSFDEYRRLLENVSFAFQGLLKCLGEFNSRNDQCDLIMCLPTEIHSEIVALSSNPTKDFAYELSLQWHAKELLFIVAQRYKKYCELYKPDLFNKLINLNTNNKRDARSILLMALPDYIENMMGIREDTIAYIMRHTQLQPRQLIQILNRIANLHDENNHIESGSIREAIHTYEGHIIEEIFSAFKISYQDAQQICDSCLPNLPIYFKLGALQQNFVRYGKKYFPDGNFESFYSMLVEMGIVGRVIKETDKYFVARFQFTVHHKLFVSYDDRLCLHPLFSGYYWNDNKKCEKRVFPYGCDVEDDEFREWLEN